MKYPKLVPPRLCTEPVRILFFGEPQTDGAEQIIAELFVKCNLQRKTKQIMTAEKKLVEIEATALFDGDIAPFASVPQGEIYFNETEPLTCENGALLETENGEGLTLLKESRPCRIFRLTKERNPDGTVNYTRAELIR